MALHWGFHFLTEGCSKCSEHHLLLSPLSVSMTILSSCPSCIRDYLHQIDIKYGCRMHSCACLCGCVHSRSRAMCSSWLDRGTLWQSCHMWCSKYLILHTLPFIETARAILCFCNMSGSLCDITVCAAWRPCFHQSRKAAGIHANVQANDYEDHIAHRLCLPAASCLAIIF
jgi:hypothetical protein